VHAFLPEGYVPDAHQRLALYRRLTHCEGEDEIDSLREEMEDRFGPLPEPGENLLHLAALRNFLRTLGVRLLTFSNGTLRVTFDSSTPVSPQRLVGLVQMGASGGIHFASEDTLAIPLDGAGEESVPVMATKTLKGLLLDASIPSQNVPS
jgi:transcription-repair coupling factor (superfamily II helicase)